MDTESDFIYLYNCRLGRPDTNTNEMVIPDVQTESKPQLKSAAEDKQEETDFIYLYSNTFGGLE